MALWHFMNNNDSQADHPPPFCIVDFAYNPKAIQPIGIFELGPLPGSDIYDWEAYRRKEGLEPIASIRRSVLPPVDAVCSYDDTLRDLEGPMVRIDGIDFQTKTNASLFKRYTAILEARIQLALAYPDLDLRPLWVEMRRLPGTLECLLDEYKRVVPDVKKQNIHIRGYGSHAFWWACQDKVVWSLFANENVAPATYIVDLEGDTPIPKAFLEKASHFVIKATNLCCGVGFMVYNVADVEQLIACLRDPSRERWVIIPEHWLSQKRGRFLIVQAFSPSHTVALGGKQFIPTGRAILEVTHAGEVGVLDMYYQFPVSPYTGEGWMRESVQSQGGNETLPHAFAHPIPEPDKQKITAWFETYFTPIVKDMIESGIQEVQTRLSDRGLSAYEYSSISQSHDLPKPDPIQCIIKSYVAAVSEYCAQLQYTDALPRHRLMGRLLGFYEQGIETLVRERCADRQSNLSWEETFACGLCKKAGISENSLNLTTSEGRRIRGLWQDYSSEEPSATCTRCIIA